MPRNDHNNDDFNDIDIDIDQLYAKYINDNLKDEDTLNTSEKEVYKRSMSSENSEKQRTRTRYRDSSSKTTKTRKSSSRKNTKNTTNNRSSRSTRDDDLQNLNTQSRPARTRRSRTEERREYYENKRKQEKARSRKAVAIVIVVLLLVVGGYFGLEFLMNNELPFVPTNAQPSTSTTQPETSAPTQPVTSPPYTPVHIDFPEISDDGTEIVQDEGIFIWDSMGFNCFKGTENSALNYANTISEFKSALGEDIEVYNMIVPNSTEFNLPDRFDEEIESNSERDNITVIYSNYTQDVKNVDIYNSLGENRNDYIFYNTDSNWTTLGAYYAYSEFMKSVGFVPIEKETLQASPIDNFYGDFATSTLNRSLLENPDTINCYTMDIDVECDIYSLDDSGNLKTTPETTNSMYKILDENDKDYSTALLYGDNPLSVIDNKSLSHGNKLLLVKDSYGNAIAPYLANNYDEVHIIDFRYYTDNIVDYCNENGISSVLFLNGIMSANSAIQVDNMKQLLK